MWDLISNIGHAFECQTTLHSEWLPGARFKAGAIIAGCIGAHLDMGNAMSKEQDSKQKYLP